ncbi:MAG: class I SAM-dependent methyltransferase [Spirochaetes bacterium]|nr:class I SAM-dependent methyltransferase [Spirochaetota bacterium]
MKNIHDEEITFSNCDSCGRDDTIDYQLFNDFKYVQCRNCGLIYQNPLPHFKPLKNRYSKKYFFYELNNQHNFFELMRKSLKDIRFHDMRFKSSNGKRRFLDIGCATGLLLNYIKQYGWDVTGIELDPFSAGYARDNFALNIINKPLEEVTLKEKSFDVIHWSHVIEHLPSPLYGLRKIHKMLKKNGVMLLTTPRVDSLQQKLFKQNWRSFHRDHITIFSKKTLCNMVKKADFKILKFFSWGGIAQEKGVPHWIKKFADTSVKLFNMGDVMFILAKKE